MLRDGSDMIHRLSTVLLQCLKTKNSEDFSRGPIDADRPRDPHRAIASGLSGSATFLRATPS